MSMKRKTKLGVSKKASCRDGSGKGPEVEESNGRGPAVSMMQLGLKTGLCPGCSCLLAGLKSLIKIGGHGKLRLRLHDKERE